MPKKKSTSPKRRKRTRRPAGKNYIIVLFFLLILGLSIYGLNYIKNLIDTPTKITIPSKSTVSEKKDLSTSLDQKIGLIESSINRSLLNLGLSKKNIVRKSSIQKKSDKVSWKFTDREILVSDKVSRDDILEEFQNSFKDEGTKVGFYIIDGHLFSEISVDGYQTHKIKFNFVRKKPVEPKRKEEKKVASVTKKENYRKSDKKEEKFVPDFSGKKAKIAIIVDDIGQNKRSIEKLIAISPKLSFAVLPHLPYSKYASDRASGAGLDVLLHLPMEPKTISGYNADDAGEGVLLVGQSKSEIIATLGQDLLSVPNVIGVNNHMGSKFTENDELMELVLEHLKQKGLFYVDSQTSGRSAGYRLAKNMGMKSAYRDVFLDKKGKGKDYVKKQLRTLVKKAESRGYAVGICHPYPQTIEALNEELPELGKYVEISSISSILSYY